MAKYLVLWELNLDKMPDDPKERGEGWAMMLEMIKQDIKEGINLDWGCFVGETKGYTISESDPVELMKLLQRFAPFVLFEVRQVLSVDDVMDVARSLSG
jgi:hypothetical protein